MPRRTFDAVVLDLDGTLVDHDAAVVAALQAWLPTMGATTSDHLVTAWRAAEQQHFARWRAGEISFAEQRRNRLRDFLPRVEQPVGRDDDLDELFGDFLRHYEAAWRCYDDVGDTLDVLAHHHVPVAVLTNGSDAQQGAKLAATGLAERVGPVTTAEAAGVAKPDRRAFLTACESLRVSPARVLHVGDDHALDVVAARRAGLGAVHLDRFGTGPEQEAIRSLSGLPPLVLEDLGR